MIVAQRVVTQSRADLNHQRACGSHMRRNGAYAREAAPTASTETTTTAADWGDVDAAFERLPKADRPSWLARATDALRAQVAPRRGLDLIHHAQERQNKRQVVFHRQHKMNQHKHPDGPFDVHNRFQQFAIGVARAKAQFEEGPHR